MKCVFGVDIGGTNIKFGKFVGGKQVRNFHLKTFINYEDPVTGILNQLIETIRKNRGEDTIVGIGVAVPGPVKDGIVLKAPNIGWEKVALRSLLEEAFPGVKIAVANDANAATLGERYFGSGRKDFVLVTVGTGIGCGIVIDGKLHEGTTGTAGELGHLKIFPYQGRQCACGHRGCLEQYAGTAGFVRTARELIGERETVLKKVSRLNAKTICNAAAAGDKTATEAVDKTAYYLAIGLAGIAAVINPSLILIGGGISKSGPLLLERIRSHFRDLAFPTAVGTEICYASLFNKAGIYGCYYLAQEQNNENRND